MKRTVIALATVFATMGSLFMCRTRPSDLQEPPYDNITIAALKNRLEAGDAPRIRHSGSSAPTGGEMTGWQYSQSGVRFFSRGD